ncbi:MAG: hypothetical protein ABS76_10880 [Pelagibacterium sp. SCN 64-44]|nr:MAG: hypothetical protein ABS76_10880 [Pelagibacterium sp. SCN 64-44]
MTSKLHTIQYLRAIAAGLVLISHALLYPTAEEVLLHARLGWLGVIVFFVVSGFIMVVVTGPGKFAPGQFLRRRVLRVVPLYWAFTLLAAALAVTLPSLFKTTVFDGLQMLLSLGFIPFYNAGSHGLHPLYKLGWTLNYEMFFYLSFALLALLGASGRIWVLTLAYLALALVGQALHPQDAIPAFYTSYLPLAFVAGAWLGFAHLKGWLEKVVPGLTWLLALVGIVALVDGFAIDRGTMEDGLAFIGLLLFAAVLVALAAGMERSLPRLPLLEKLGDASYSIYLTHIFVVAGVVGVVRLLFGADNPWIVWGAAMAAIPVGIAAGCLLYRLIEEPLLRRLRRLA